MGVDWVDIRLQELEAGGGALPQNPLAERSCGEQDPRENYFRKMIVKRRHGKNHNNNSRRPEKGDTKFPQSKNGDLQRVESGVRG